MVIATSPKQAHRRGESGTLWSSLPPFNRLFDSQGDQYLPAPTPLTPAVLKHDPREILCPMLHVPHQRTLQTARSRNDCL